MGLGNCRRDQTRRGAAHHHPLRRLDQPWREQLPEREPRNRLPGAVSVYGAVDGNMVVDTAKQDRLGVLEWVSEMVSGRCVALQVKFSAQPENSVRRPLPERTRAARSQRH